MTYQEAIDYLFTQTPVFQRDGGSAYKPGLERMSFLDEHYGYPHRDYRTIHIAGTNGKGSTSHTLAAILQSCAYRVGLFTSPHLLDFRERIRVNGEMVSEDFVIDFVEQCRGLVDICQPSFFELTTMMAFAYFRSRKVDVAVIEVGLGGRLDSTNVITPMLSVITNVSLEHTQYLGDTLDAIAGEKAGVIKPGVPVVIGSVNSDDVRRVFETKAKEVRAPLCWAQDSKELAGSVLTDVGYVYQTARWGTLYGELTGVIQSENTATVLACLPILAESFDLTSEGVARGFARVVESTGLLGRWQTLSKKPRIVCDTGHNPAGLEQVARQIESLRCCYAAIHIVIGVASDKDARGMLALLPSDALYYFTEAKAGRAMPADILAHQGLSLGLQGDIYSSVAEALAEARCRASLDDLIFVGGSNFVVADLLQIFRTS